MFLCMNGCYVYDVWFDAGSLLLLIQIYIKFCDCYMPLSFYLSVSTPTCV